MNGSPVQAGLWHVTQPILYVNVVEAYGTAKRGVSNALYVLAENGNEYFAKGPSRSPDNPYVAMNEMLSIQLAGLLGLPVLDYSILRMGSDLLFGTTRMKASKFSDELTEGEFRQCINQDRIYDMVVLDVWLCNRDRHPGNLIARHTVKPARRGAVKVDERVLVLNDHSHCPIDPLLHLSPSKLSGFINASIESAHVGKIPFVPREIRDTRRLRQSLDMAQSVSDTSIQSIIQRIPAEFLPVDERIDVATFLIERRLRLRQVFENGRHLFERLGSGAL